MDAEGLLKFKGACFCVEFQPVKPDEGTRQKQSCIFNEHSSQAPLAKFMVLGSKGPCQYGTGMHFSSIAYVNTRMQNIQT